MILWVKKVQIYQMTSLTPVWLSVSSLLYSGDVLFVKFVTFTFERVSITSNTNSSAAEIWNLLYKYPVLLQSLERKHNIDYAFLYSNFRPTLRFEIVAVTQHHTLGGLNMVILENFILSLKCSWIQTAIKVGQSWLLLFLYVYG